MSGAEEARETDFKEASTRLSEGLENCRTVVENYRGLLGGERAASAEESPSACNDDVQEITVEAESSKSSSI